MREKPVEKQHWTRLETRAADDVGPTSRRPTDGAGSDVRAALESLPTVDRRSFFKMMGLALAAGALSGCRKPVEKILPYLDPPPEATPGVAQWYASTCPGCSAGCGVLVKVRDGRPIKLEGNPDHLMSQGGLCATGQAAVLGLYDAHRQKAPAANGTPTTWDQVDREVRQRLAAARLGSGKVVALTSTLTGPATRALLAEFLATFPRSEQVVYDAVSYDAIQEAHRQAYGQPLIPGYRFDEAEVLVSFGADFLGTWLSPVEFTRQYAAGRDPATRPPPSALRPSGLSCHFQFESRLSLTGSNADYRYAIAPSEQADYLAALVARVAQEVDPTNPLAHLPTRSLPPEAEPRLAKVTAALLAAQGRGLVVSDSNDVSVQWAVLALNELLGNVGRTGAPRTGFGGGQDHAPVDLRRPSLQKQGRDADLVRLVEEMERGEVAVLLIHGCNPAYTYPDAEKFAAALRKVPCSVSFAVTPDETARRTLYHCPAHHPLEVWGDAEPQAGRFSLFQPTIRPLYDTRAFEDSLLRWSGRDLSFHDYLKRYWQTEIFPRQGEWDDFTAFWDQMLQRGFLEVTPPRQDLSPLSWDEVAAALRNPPLAKGGPGGVQSALRPPPSTLEVEVFESVALREGTAANNPWLQELPDPITKITWDNYAAIAPALAQERSIQEGQWLELTAAGRTVKVPAHLQPGQHARTISLALGYGRTQAGPVGNGVGVNAYPLLATCAGRRQTARPLEGLRPLDGTVGFARTQIHDSQEGRPLVREITSPEAPPGPPAGPHAASGEPADLWAKHEYPEYHWGMVIDLSRCTGCSACVVSCDLENNVPAVGRKEVRRQREMHWLRLDRYFTGDPENPGVVHQPMLCQHCGNATCETVCPALATVHDDQGLNVQVYNRCVGTRYCANNCPYKVRRFNFFNHTRDDPTQNLALNPDVTVRTRGVMEKCSFCLQRIQAARLAARCEGRKVRDGEVQTACQQSCPAGAITFGNLADPRSRVARLAADPRRYRVLEELNRQPAVYYLAKVRNNDEGMG